MMRTPTSNFRATSQQPCVVHSGWDKPRPCVSATPQGRVKEAANAPRRSRPTATMQLPEGPEHASYIRANLATPRGRAMSQAGLSTTSRIATPDRKLQPCVLATPPRRAKEAANAPHRPEPAATEQSLEGLEHDTHKRADSAPP